MDPSQIPIDSVSDIGSTGLFAYLAWRLLDRVTRFLDRVEVHLEAQKDQAKDEAAAWDRVAQHLTREEAHQGRVEELLRSPREQPAPAIARGS